ncbi:hypothetical protein [Labilibacter marinus]|uniref:hypothetical protein n=1 Tax=Labilibacter marinus TaxID=1477105 RepID=UPI00082BBAC0|nr:hypothetical protein [Labilibacter marinus]
MQITGESKIVLIIISMILCASCAREAYNISYKGVIVDEETNCPLAFSEVQSFCLFQQNIDESGTQKINTKTNTEGEFLLKFNKGYKISLAIEAEDYINQFIQFKPQPNHAPDTIYLKRKLIYHSSTETPTTDLP